jgi:hypothetical protein
VIAVGGVSVVVHAARFVIDQMSADDGSKGQQKQPVLMLMPDLFGNKERYSKKKNRDRSEAVVVLSEAVPQRVHADRERQQDHEVFKFLVVDDIHAEYR